jgi:tetratricopeptide (TPR) repeat protein
MAIDTYAPCPGGTGKKIKFCCADLMGDLEQVQKLIEGEQISAALDQVKRVSEKHPGRACLMATRVKLELATKQYAEAEAASRAFLEAHPENPLALAQRAVTEAIAGRIQESAASFDKAREVAATAARQEGMQDVTPELARIAGMLVHFAAETHHSGFGHALVEWLAERGLSSDEEQRMLAALVASSGIPPWLRTRVPLAEIDGHESWRPDFDIALGHALAWRLTKALTGFRSLRSVAASSGAVHTNIAVLCEMLAKPVEASEAWLALAKLPDTPADDAIEATGRAIALETEANPERSPLVRFANRIAPLAVPTGEEGTTALELLEDKLRHDPQCEPASFDRSQWVSRDAAPPRSAWRVYEAGGGDSPRLLASLLIFGRQTDREPEAVLQGLAPDVEASVPVVTAVLGVAFEPSQELDGMPSVTPTTWLLGGQFKTTLPTAQPPAPASGEPALFDTVLAAQRKLVDDRLVHVWPDTALPELLGKTPRQAMANADGQRRVAALVLEGEAASRRRDVSAAWARLRQSLGLPEASRIESAEPLGGLPPMRWHRVDCGALSMDQLRGLLVTAMDAGFELAAERAATELVSRPDATPEDRWESLGFELERAESSVRRLELIAAMRPIASELKANDGSLDVMELRTRMQRGDEADAMRLLNHISREHANDREVMQAVAETLREAGVDLQALAAQNGGGMPASAAPPAGAAAGKLWTPGGEQPSAGGEKKTIWTPGS